MNLWVLTVVFAVVGQMLFRSWAAGIFVGWFITMGVLLVGLA